MKYFDGLIVGDEVYSTSDEWGIVTQVDETSAEVCFNNKKMKRFSLNGRVEGNPCQVLFYGVPDPWSTELPKRKDDKKSSRERCSHNDCNVHLFCGKSLSVICKECGEFFIVNEDDILYLKYANMIGENQPTKHIERLLEKFDEKIHLNEGIYSEKEHCIENSLYHLLKRFKNDLPLVNFYFHKAFRQTDVIDIKNGEGEIDIAIYNLLCISKLFWMCYEETIKELGEEE